jgi:hypothetical protein
MGYVQVDQGIVTHRKTLRLARLLGESRYTVVGRLVALWCWSLDSAISGALRDVDAEILADVMGWDSACGKPADLFEALITVGYLDLDEDGVLRLHNWWKYKRENPGAHEEWRRLRPTLTPVILARDGYACVYCGATTDLTIDHRIPLSRGGNNSLSNLCAACLRCNQAKYNKTPEEWQS